MRYDYERLRARATEEQTKIIDAILEHGSHAAAAPHVGLHRSNVDRMVLKLHNLGGLNAGPPRDGTDPYLVKGASTLFNRHGEQVAQWVKTSIDHERRWELLKLAIEERASRITPRRPIAPPRTTGPKAERLLNLVTLTDCHVGMLAWDKETGGDWDIKIAQKTLTDSFCGMIRAMPRAKTCIINQLGDFLHTDGMTPITPGHGHVLDADSRFQKTAMVASEILEDIVVCALQHHDKVHIIMAEGNHDESSSVWLRVMFRRIFRDDPRVTVDITPLPYYAYEHGETMLAFHHGHKLKPEQLAAFFANQFSRMWGRTTRRYGHSGHQHHLFEQDKNGMRWLQHPTIAERDAYAARGGWLSPREAIGITYDKDLGEVWRMFVSPGMFAE